jgi:hypothetical protein
MTTFAKFCKVSIAAAGPMGPAPKVSPGMKTGHPPVKMNADDYRRMMGLNPRKSAVQETTVPTPEVPRPFKDPYANPIRRGASLTDKSEADQEREKTGQPLSNRINDPRRASNVYYPKNVNPKAITHHELTNAGFTHKGRGNPMQDVHSVYKAPNNMSRTDLKGVHKGMLKRGYNYEPVSHYHHIPFVGRVGHMEHKFTLPSAQEGGNDQHVVSLHHQSQFKKGGESRSRPVRHSIWNRLADLGEAVTPSMKRLIGE